MQACLCRAASLKGMVALGLVAYELYPLYTRHVATQEFNWLTPTPEADWPAHLHHHNTTYGTIQASRSVHRRCQERHSIPQLQRQYRKQQHRQQRVALLMSYFVNNKSNHMANVAAPETWRRIRRATRANHAAVAAAASLPYTSEGRNGDHPRCGKLRAVANALRRVPIGQWLFYVDADLGLLSASAAYCGETGHVAREPATPGGACSSASGRLFDALLTSARRAAWERDGSDPSIFSFGASYNHDLTDFMAFRHDELARGWLERFTSMQAHHPVLCRLFTAPDGIVFSSMALDDICAMVRVEGLDLTRHVLHLIGSSAKGNAGNVRKFVQRMNGATACVRTERRGTSQACVPVCQPWQPCISRTAA